MLLQNPLYSYIYQYTRDINSKKDDHHAFKTTYNCRSKEKDCLINYQCFNIECIISKHGIIVDTTKYNGYLDFTFNHDTNEVYINHVPTYNNPNIKIPVFTSDIAKIIIQEIQKYTTPSTITIKFKDKLSPLVFDKEITSVVPSIQQASNYQITKHIITNIQKEIERINKTISSYKSQQNRKIKIMERIYNKKRKIYDIDPINYSSINEFHQAINDTLAKRIQSILSKIDKHLLATENAYKKLLIKQLIDYFNASKSTNYTEEQLNEIIQDENTKNEVYLLLLDKLENVDMNTSFLQNDSDFIKQFTDFLWNHDTKDEQGLLSQALYIQDFLSGLRGSEYLHCSQALNIEFIYEYQDNHFLKPYSHKTKYKYLNWLKQIKNASIDENYRFHPNIKTVHTCPLFQGINLLLQYHTLNKQKKHYEYILNNINQFNINPNNYLNLHGFVLQLPYWFQKTDKSLLMIKPGCTHIDLNKIPNIIFNNQPEKYNLTLCKEKRFYQQDDEAFPYQNESVLTITIPKSLPYNELIKLIDFFKNDYSTILYICEDQDTYIKTKSTIIDNYLKDFNQLQKKEKIRDSYICIDPSYYDTYFKTTPTPDNYYHLYDYTTNYPFRKKHIMSIENLCNIFINREKEKQDNINHSKIKISLLGSYNYLDQEENLYSLDETKYTALNYYVRIPNLFQKKRWDQKIYYNKKGPYDDFFDVFGHNDSTLKSIFRSIEDITPLNDFEYTYNYLLNGLFSSCYNMIMVKKDQDQYQALSKDEIENNMHKLGNITNINVALFTGYNVILWKNFPQVPLIKEDIPLDKVKTYIKRPPIKPLPDDYELPF